MEMIKNNYRNSKYHQNVTKLMYIFIKSFNKNVH
jgi:hypothetical protein